MYEQAPTYIISAPSDIDIAGLKAEFNRLGINATTYFDRLNMAIAPLDAEQKETLVDKGYDIEEDRPDFTTCDL